MLGSPQLPGVRRGRAQGALSGQVVGGPGPWPSFRADAEGPRRFGAGQPASGKIKTRPVRWRKLPRGAGQTAAGVFVASILERAAGPAQPPLWAGTWSPAGEAGSRVEPRPARGSRVDAPGPKFRASGPRVPEAYRARTSSSPAAKGQELALVLPQTPPAASSPEEE